MDDRLSYRPDAGSDLASGWVAFSLAGERFALPMAAVEAAEPPPRLARIPHADRAVLGAGNFAGQIVPVLDLARLIDRQLLDRQPFRRERAYDGSGEILRLRLAEGGIGLWIDRVERLMRVEAGEPAPEGVALLDPEHLFDAALAPLALELGAAAPLGDVGELAAPAAIAAPGEAFILVQVAGKTVHLARDAVVELIETVSWTPLPRAPAGLLGIGVLRGSALPILSLASLLGLPQDRPAGGYAVAEIERHRMLLATDRIIGLRYAATGSPIDVAAAVPEELRRIVCGFAAGDGALSAASAGDGETGEYLSFTVAGQDFAVAVGCVDRIVGARPLIALPRPAAGSASDRDAGAPIIGVIELSGRVVPVAALQPRLERALGGLPANWAPSAYVILRDPEGLGAIGVDRVKQVVRLRLDDISTPPGEHGLIEAFAASADGEPLHIIAAAQLWGAG